MSNTLSIQNIYGTDPNLTGILIETFEDHIKYSYNFKRKEIPEIIEIYDINSLKIMTR